MYLSYVNIVKHQKCKRPTGFVKICNWNGSFPFFSLMYEIVNGCKNICGLTLSVNLVRYINIGNDTTTDMWKYDARLAYFQHYIYTYMFKKD